MEVPHKIWEQKIPVLQVGKTRMHSHSLELQADSTDAPANDGQPAFDLESVKTKSIILEGALRAMLLTGLDESCALASEGLKRSIQPKYHLN